MSNNQELTTHDVVELTWADACQVQAKAARDHVAISRTSDKTPTRWFGVKVGLRVVAIGGLAELRPGRWRIRNDWVAEDHRGSGLGMAVLLHRLALVPAGASIDVFSFHPDTYRALGWTEGKPNRFGAVHFTFTKPEETDK